MLVIYTKPALYEVMVREKNFLAKLYLSENDALTKKIIVNSTEGQLNILIQVTAYFLTLNALIQV